MRNLISTIIIAAALVINATNAVACDSRVPDCLLGDAVVEGKGFHNEHECIKYDARTDRWHGIDLTDQGSKSIITYKPADVRVYTMDGELHRVFRPNKDGKRTAHILLEETSPTVIVSRDNDEMIVIDSYRFISDKNLWRVTTHNAHGDTITQDFPTSDFMVFDAHGQVFPPIFSRKESEMLQRDCDTKLSGSLFNELASLNK